MDDKRLASNNRSATAIDGAVQGELAFDPVEIVKPFLPDDCHLTLRERAITWKDHCYFFIGRYLAQLHLDSKLMRDLHPKNIMFRRQDGYPVLIDEPIANLLGLDPRMSAGDFFTPFLTFGKSAFEALLTGYALSAQRLIDPKFENFTQSVLDHLGGTVETMTRWRRDRTFTDVANALRAPGIPQIESRNSRRLDDIDDSAIIWTVIILNICGYPASELQSLLALQSKTCPLWQDIQDSFDFSNQTFLFMRAGWPGFETGLLNGIAANYAESKYAFSPPMNFSATPLSLKVLVELKGRSASADWADMFSIFWIQALCALSAALEGRDRTASMQAQQIAHVILQHVSFEHDLADDMLQTLRCEDASRDWYWLAPETAGALSCFLLFKNTESNTLAKYSNQFYESAVDQLPLFFHTAFDAIENDRNIIGNCVALRRSETDIVAEQVIDISLRASLRRLFGSHTSLFTALYSRPITCYSYAYNPTIWTRSGDGQLEGSKQGPQWLAELMLLKELVPSLERKTWDELKTELGWTEAAWGYSWYGPGDPLGERRFEPRILGNDLKNSTIVRAGSMMVVVGAVVLGGKNSQIIERLWPLPNADMGSSYRGGPA